MVKYVNGAELEELIAKSEKPVFCDFWATWCGPCRMLAPVFEAVSDKYEDKAVFVKIDVDDEASESAAIKYGISSIPNIIVFKNGKPAANNLGFVPEATLEKFVQDNL
ncbi:MAG: thioredoxin [Clostridia bacterium]|nr:thioredoxin [Clostridia bacterium]